jgi:membrane-bound serine protease (ClpP class)
MKHFYLCLLLILSTSLVAQTTDDKVVVFEIREDISPSATRIVSKGLNVAKEIDASLVIIDMDTYGGLLVDADSIRKAILDAPMPVYVLINKNAGSAGALISIACDKIYMAKGATIGSATVVNESGEVAPDKYQSYMRSIMRATAESHGKDTIIKGSDTIFQYRRNPQIAEAMVDERISVPGVVDSGRIAAFTTSEAIEVGYCEGEAGTVEEILEIENITDYSITIVTKSSIDKLIGFLSGPAIQGVLIMFIFWGIFFEIRTPGIGFPLLAAVLSALVYFAPLYLDGLAANWEILLFVVGMVLIALEIFVIPGFGVAGISGITLTVTSLILSLIRNINFDFSNTTSDEVNKALIVVFMALVGFIVGLILFGKGLLNSPLSKKIVLSHTLKDARVGEIPVDGGDSTLIGQNGIAHTDIRPMGKININDQIFDCKSLSDFISEGDSVVIVSREFGYWVVEKA